MRFLSRPVWLVVLGLVAAVCAGCDGCKDRAAEQSTAEPAVETETAPHVPFTRRTVVAERKHTVFQKPPPLPQQEAPTVVEPGQAPRRALRYQPDLEARELVIAARIETRELAGGQWSERTALPEIRYGLGMQRSGRQGVLEVNLRGLQAEVADRPAGSQAGAGERAQTLTADFLARYQRYVERRRATLDLNDRGRLGEIKLSPDAAQGPHADEIRQEIYQLLLESVVPLPDEPVGRGARWSATATLRRGLAVVTQRAEYELLDASKDRLRVRATLTQIGERQLLPTPGLPPSVTVEMLALFWQAQGEFEVSPASLAPISGTLGVEMRVHTRLRQAGREQDHFVESKGSVTLTAR